jgi:ribose transport system ATP-binding protein
MSAVLLKMKGIFKEFPGVQALQDVDFSSQIGEVHGLIGENGSGKSTLVKILYGQYLPDAGSISIRGKKESILSPQIAQENGISYISQEISLVPLRSVAENVMMGRIPKNKIHMVDHTKLYSEVKKLMDTLQAEIDPKTPVCDLNVNLQQIVAIARALAVNASIIIMDEVTSSLTDKDVEMLFRVINVLKSRGISFIFITHRLKEVFQICDQVTILRDGKKIADSKVSEVDEDMLIKSMVGRSLGDYFFKKSVPIKETLLEIKGMKSPPLLENINLKIRAGEIVGLSGLVGSGRSEIAMALVGRRKIVQGQVILRKKKLTIRSPVEAFKAGIALVPEDRKRQALVLPLSVKHNFSLACLQMFSPISNFGLIRAKAETDLTKSFFDRLKVKTPTYETEIQWLSGGNQQKIVIARWLVKNPMIFILDEPTRGIDVGAKSEIYRIMGEIVETGSAIIMISSDLLEILGLSDRVLVMFQGKIVKELLKEEASEEKIAFYATGQKDQ